MDGPSVMRSLNVVIQVLVNNAAVGISSSRTEHIKQYPKLPLRPTDHTRSDFDEVFAVNVYGVVDTISAFDLPCSVHRG